ncbi:MAG: sortase family protein [Bryobacterales bacterium]|jgi:sortase A|nr:sortase family protein [Bryobacterales bacterium]
MRQQRWLVWLGSALLVGGAVLVAWYALTLHERVVAQRAAKEWLIETSAVPHAGPAPPIRRGDVIGELGIPRLQVSVMVFEGDDAGILGQGAGHIPGTALTPGSGNIGIAAHRDTYFRPLSGLRASDVITLKTPSGTSLYTVTETTIVRPSEIGVLARAPGRDLTLVTCYPFFYVGSAPERFIVHARKIG